MADINGDGLSDLIGRSGEKFENHDWYVCTTVYDSELEEGADTRTETLDADCFQAPYYHSARTPDVLVVDVDANGLSEILHKAVDKDGNDPANLVCTHRDNSNACKTLTLPGPAGESIDLDKIQYAADVTGDGATDFIVRQSGSDPWLVCSAHGQFEEFLPGNLVLPNYQCMEDNQLPTRLLDGEFIRLFLADFNGDGTADAIHHKGSAQNPSAWLINFSDGKKFLPAEEWIGHSGGPDNNKIADFNGDGKADMAANRAEGGGSGSGWHIVYAGAGGFVSLVNDTFANVSVDNSFTGDFDGDGRTEIAGITGNRSSVHISFSTGLSAPYLKEVISEIPSDSPVLNAQKTRLKLNYGYTKSKSDWTPSYPNRFINGNIHVVTGASVPNHTSVDGDELWDTVNYAFDNMLVNRRGLGILGFGIRSETDQRRKVYTRYEYRQDYPYIGTLSKTSTRSTRSDNSEVLVSAVDHKYGVESNGGSCYEQSGDYYLSVCKPYRIHRTSETTDTYDYVTGNHLTKVENTFNKVAGTVAVGAFDNYEYGKPRHIITVTTDKTKNISWTKKTTNSFEHRLADIYQVGLLSTSKVEHSTTDASVLGTITKESGFNYYPNGQLKEEVIEPNKTSVDERSAYLKTTHFYDAKYGFKTGSKAEGYDYKGAALPARETSIKTEFVTGTTTTDIIRRETVTNSLGHEAVVEKSLEHGKVLYSKDVNGNASETKYLDRWANKPETRVTGGVTSKVSSHYWVSGDADAPAGAMSKRTMQYTVTDSDETAAPDQIEYFDANGKVLKSISRGYTDRDVFVLTWYDSFGRKVAQTQPHFRGNGYRSASWDYLDSTDRVEKETSIDGTVTSYSYSNHDMTRTSDGRTHKEYRNAAGNIYLVEEGSEADASKRASITYRYDAAGRLVRTIDGDSNKTIISYDVRDRKTRQDDPDMGVWIYKFNSFGEMEWQQDAKGQISNSEYDQLGRVTTTWDNSGTETRTWDTAPNGIGSLHKVAYGENGAGFNHYEKTLAYDSLSRVDASSECLRGSVTSGCSSYKTGFEYDNQSRVKKTIMHGGISIERSYQNNQLKKLTRGDGKVLWFARSVNALGQLDTEQQGNGVVTRYGYDKTLLASIKAEKLGNIVADQTYTYHAGNAQLHVRTDNIYGMEETFGYDQHMRVSTLTKKYRGISDELIYGYDSLGNINSKPDVAETAGKTYVYGKGIRVDGAGPHAIKSLGSQTFTYDANGNLVDDGTRSVVWTAFNKPFEITAESDQGDMHTTRFQYGVGGTRLKRMESRFDPAFEITEDLGTTTYLDGGGAAQIERIEKDGTTKLKYQYQLGSRVIAIDTVEEDQPPQQQTETRYLHHDHLGSVIAMTDKVGGVLERYSFDVWGKPRTLQATSASVVDSIIQSPVHTKGFTGHEMLDEVGLVHMNGRIYDPALGRFLSADPHIQYAHNTQSFNRYSYVLNNPVGATDPTGYFTKWLRQMNDKHSWFKYVAAYYAIGAAVFTTIVTGGAGAPAIAQGILAGFAGAFTGSYLSGAGFRNSVSAGVTGALYGGLSAGAANVIGYGEHALFAAISEESSGV